MSDHAAMPVKFVRYEKPEQMARIIGRCARGHCGGAVVTGSVWDSDDIETAKFLFTCDNERCIAEAVRRVAAGGGV